MNEGAKMKITKAKVTKIVNGEYTPTEASKIVEGIIDKQINFQKLNYVTQWEKNHSLTMDSLNEEVNNLLTEKERLLKTIKQAKLQGKKIVLDSSIAVNILD